MVADRDSCHAHLCQEFKRVDEDLGWQAFLERAQKRAVAESPTTAPDCIEPTPYLKHALEAQYPTPNDDGFYKVPVQVRSSPRLCDPFITSKRSARMGDNLHLPNHEARFI
jgi:hypothetical protein